MKVFALIAGALVVILIWANWRAVPLPAGARADKILVEKSERRLLLLRLGKPFRVYRIALGRTPIGHKEHEGDGRTPEGSYRIDSRKPDSSFHRALHVSYPNSRDLQAARSKGVDPGGAIMIHGIRNGLGWLGDLHNWVDWTAGCMAVTDWEIEELWRAVPDGTPIEIVP
jgi:murein L,D-transpeptidase YafK